MQNVPELRLEMQVLHIDLLTPEESASQSDVEVSSVHTHRLK